MEDNLGLLELLVDTCLELDLDDDPCLRSGLCLGTDCSLSPGLEFDVCWETGDEKFVFGLSVRWDVELRLGLS